MTRQRNFVHNKYKETYPAMWHVSFISTIKTNITRSFSKKYGPNPHQKTSIKLILFSNKKISISKTQMFQFWLLMYVVVWVEIRITFQFILQPINERTKLCIVYRFQFLRELQFVNIQLNIFVQNWIQTGLYDAQYFERTNLPYSNLGFQTQQLMLHSLSSTRVGTLNHQLVLFFIKFSYQIHNFRTIT